MVAECFTPSMVIEADALWAHVVRGFIEPWKKASVDQNRALVRASLAAAARLASSGYATVLSGHVGPSFMHLFDTELADLDTPVVYMVVRPSLEECLAHCAERRNDPRHAGALDDKEIIGQLYRTYSNLGEFERYVIDTGGLTTGESAALVVSELDSRRFALA